MKAPYTQQGDAIIAKCGVKGVFKVEFDDIPKDAEPVEGGLVLKGQTNSHGLFGGKFKLFKKDKYMFIDVEKTTTLDHVKDMSSRAHAEHHAQKIPPGKYFVPEVLEYSHADEEAKRIVD